MGAEIRVRTASRAGLRFAWRPGLVCLVLALTAAPARAIVIPAAIVAGPSPTILGVGNVAMAPDGTGGVVWRALEQGQAHVFVSRYAGGHWSAPIEVDPGQPGPATFPAIAAGDNGELLVVWVQPWASISSAGQPPTTAYQLVSAVMQPGSNGFGPPVQVDPNNVADGSGVYPALSMAPNGTAYVVYRVVTNPLSPNLPQPPGTISPMRSGDELVDVRVARFNGLFWSSAGTINRLPADVTMRKPSTNNAPAIAVDPSGAAIAVWQEPTIDGVARIWARRIFGTTQGNVLPVSPQTIINKPVSVDADAPSISINNFAGAEAGFRLGGGAGSPLSAPALLVNAIPSTVSQNGASFTGAVPIAGANTVGPPSVSVGDAGQFESAFTAGGNALVVSGTSSSAEPPEALGPSIGAPAMATLDPDGGGAVVWPSLDSSGRPVVRVRETFPAGDSQLAALSAPISGPISSLTIGPSSQGDALIAFEQGLSSTAQVAVADIQAPPLQFATYAPASWVTPQQANISWDPAPSASPSVRYAILVDGQITASGLTGLSFRLDPRGLGDGTHRVQVLAVDALGQETLSVESNLQVDASPPTVITKLARVRKLIVQVSDRESGPDPSATVISFGDGSRPARNQLTAIHRYRRRGTYLVTVRCADLVGNRATHRLLLKVR
jgi:hypothetical protein